MAMVKLDFVCASFQARTHHSRIFCGGVKKTLILMYVRFVLDLELFWRRYQGARNMDY